MHQAVAKDWMGDREVGRAQRSTGRRLSFTSKFHQGKSPPMFSMGR